MTGTELKTFTESILDGLTVADDFFYQLLNVAKTKLEAKRLWQYLKKLDDSNTAASGNNYQTGYNLPSDFAEDYRLFVGKDTEYYPIPFEEQHLSRGASLRYLVDLGQSKLFLMGNVRADTIYLYYKRFTDDLNSSTSPVFPVRFHPLLGFYVAAYYQNGVDADDIFARMSPENRAAALDLENAMVTWDFALASRGQNDRLGMEGGMSGVDLSQM